MSESETVPTPAAETPATAVAEAIEAAPEAVAEPSAPAVEAAAVVESEASSVADAPAEGQAEGAAAGAAPVSGAKAKAKPAAKGDKGPKRAKEGKSTGAKRSARDRGARSEEFVKPSDEDLAGIPSDTVREAVAVGGPVGGKIIGWNQGGFHAVVDGISAFCPRSSMELGAPHEPAQYLDQEYLFRVLRVEEKGRRLVLSRAAILRDEKRHEIEEKKKALVLGTVVKGKVVSLLDFGAFVDMGGIEGLVHVSEIQRKRVGHPKEVLEVGQEVEAKIVKLPAKGERVSLSIKALEPDPWDGAGEKWPTGGKFTGTVARKSDFGWFVELAPGVEGLLHPSQLPPGVKETDPTLQPGATIEGWVRELDLEKHRVSLALREVPTSDPWKDAGKKYAEGETVTGKIEKHAPFGAFIELEPGLTGLFPTSEMGLPRGASVGKAYPVGKQIKLKVSEIDTRRRRISLTRLEKTLEGSKADLSAYRKQAVKSDSMGALAAAFARLKA